MAGGNEAKDPGLFEEKSYRRTRLTSTAQQKVALRNAGGTV
jgi:hypothetical protein